MITGRIPFDTSASRMRSCRDKCQDFFRTCCCRCRCEALPFLVLMRVRIVANASDDETGQAVHQSCCLHLEAEDSPKLRAQPVSRESVLHNLVARSYCTIMDDRLFAIP